jgi:hypothetical protein
MRHGLKRFSFLSVCIILLLFALAIAQTLFVARNQIVSQFPETRSTLSLACNWLQQHVLPCSFSLSRDLKKLSIEDTALLQSKTRFDVIKLSGAISNHGRDVQAYPNLEVNLTNIENIAVVRRYLKPYEYVPAPDKGIAPLSTETFSVNFIAEGLVDGVTVTGYQVKISY